MAQPTVQDLVARNAELAKTHEPIPFLSESIPAGIPLPKIAIFTCVDPRCVPEYFLGLKIPEALVFRNVCGHVEEGMNHLLALDHLTSGLQEIMVIHHTDCGALQFKDEDIRTELKERVPGHATYVDKVKSFGGIQDVEQSVKDDLDVLRSSPLLRKELVDKAYGFTWDIKTGLLKPVDY